MAKLPDHERIWRTVSRALGTELREGTAIIGASGIEHHVQAIAVDDATKRVIVIADEPNPRSAALMQVDIQATMPGARVLVARPVMFDISDVTQRVFSALSEGTLDPLSVITSIQNLGTLPPAQTGERINSELGPVMERFVTGARRTRISAESQVVGLLQQIMSMRWDDHLTSSLSLTSIVSVFMSVVGKDGTEADRLNGICAIPLYNFSDDDWENLLSGRRIAAVRERLKELGIYQYFYPAPDELMLGMAENGRFDATHLTEAASRAPELGHPFGSPEFLSHSAALRDMLENLKDAGYLAEADLGLTVTDQGKELRSEIRIRPREGFIQKLSRLVAIKADFSLKDLK